MSGDSRTGTSGARIGRLSREALGDAVELLGRACAYDEAALVGEEKLFGGSPTGDGVTLGAWDDASGGRLVGVAAGAGRWLRLVAVSPEARGRGIGTALVEGVAAAVRAAGGARLRTGDQPGNYLAPGIDARDQATIAWFERRGFGWVGANENLAVPLVGNDRVTAARAAQLAASAATRGYDVRRASIEADGAELDKVVRKAFFASWASEVAAAMRGGELREGERHAGELPSVHVARERRSGAIVAFAAHDGNNRGLGWFGPTGTLDSHRRRGLGEALLIPCLLDVAAAGRAEAVIAWIGPKAYYERACGAVPGRKFVVLEKNL